MEVVVCPLSSPPHSPPFTRYRFIIDGIITLPIALYGFIVFPDVPVSTKAFYLSKEVNHFFFDYLDANDILFRIVFWLLNG